MKFSSEQINALLLKEEQRINDAKIYEALKKSAKALNKRADKLGFRIRILIGHPCGDIAVFKK